MCVRHRGCTRALPRDHSAEKDRRAGVTGTTASREGTTRARIRNGCRLDGKVPREPCFLRRGELSDNRGQQRGGRQRDHFEEQALEKRGRNIAH